VVVGAEVAGFLGFGGLVSVFLIGFILLSRYFVSFSICSYWITFVNKVVKLLFYFTNKFFSSHSCLFYYT